MTFTKSDLQTISLALHYACQDRDGFADANHRKGPVAKQAEALIKRMDKLHRKLFNEPTMFTQLREQDRLTPSISIFDIQRTDT
jgi:hypothetical protein